MLIEVRAQYSHRQALDTSSASTRTVPFCSPRTYFPFGAMIARCVRLWNSKMNSVGTALFVAMLLSSLSDQKVSPAAEVEEEAIEDRVKHKFLRRDHELIERYADRKPRRCIEIDGYLLS